MSKDLLTNITELQAAIKGYVQTKFDLAQLTFIEKSSRIITILISSLVVILFSVFIVVFGVVILVVWYNQTFNNLFEGLLIGIFVLLLILILFLLLRKWLVTSYLVKHFSEILNEPDNNDT